jgi:hypothetical protein
MTYFKNIFASSTLLLIAFTLISCSSSHTAPTTHLSENTSYNKLKAGSSGVYVLRTDGYFYNTPSLYLDDKPLGEMASASYLYSHLQPGTHTLSINQGYLDGTMNYKLDIKPGQVLYLNMAWGKLQKNQTTARYSTDNFFTNNRGWVLSTVSESKGQDLLSQLKFGNQHSGAID